MCGVRLVGCRFSCSMLIGGCSSFGVMLMSRCVVVWLLVMSC